MRLYLMRHAEAGDADARRWPDDRDRPLTDAGEREHAVVAATLARMGVRFDRLLTSPLVRARRTAEITAAVYGGAPAPEETPALDDHATVPGFLAVLARLPRDAAVLAVGHEPLLSATVGALVSRDGAARVVMPKSGVAAIELDGTPAPGGGRLLFHLRPHELVRLAEGGSA
ncbi:MAG TPA: phosphohistidine phosphatase SixA [Methylomirabilota bacterium]|nr:phosphohistidine phosphatase SixA [Methylomirabilota bacterium]